MISQTVRNDQAPVVEQGAAGINDVWHVTFALVFVRLDQRLAETADHLARVLAIQKERADAVLSHRPGAVAEDHPPGIGLDGRAAIPELDQLPRKGGSEEQLAFVP